MFVQYDLNIEVNYVNADGGSCIGPSGVSQGIEIGEDQ